MLTYSVKKPKIHLNFINIFNVCSIVYIILSTIFVNNYLALSVLQLTAIIVYALIAPVQTIKKANNLLLILSLLFVLLYVQTQITSFLFLSLVILIIEFISISIGKLSINAYLMVLLCSPIFSVVASIIGFPLRLQLTKLASNILQMVVENCNVSGNQILINQQPFIIDEACAGLHMLLAGLIFAVFIVEYFKRKRKQQLPFVVLMFFYTMTIVSVLINNIFRICILVLFKIFPDNSMHYGIGIIVFIVYTIIPMYILLYWLFNRYGKTIAITNTTVTQNQINRSLILMILIMLVGCSSMLFLQPNIKPIAQLPLNQLSTFEKSNLDFDIVKYKKNNQLIYIKPMPYFFSSEHNPLFCWKGSGYNLDKFENVKINDNNIYIGELNKNNNIIYTAWFYTNGTVCTTKQFKWRWLSFLQQEPFYLVNVSSNSKKEITELTNKLFYSIK